MDVFQKVCLKWPPKIKIHFSCHVPIDWCRLVIGTSMIVATVPIVGKPTARTPMVDRNLNDVRATGPQSRHCQAVRSTSAACHPRALHPRIRDDIRLTTQIPPSLMPQLTLHQMGRWVHVAIGGPAIDAHPRDSNSRHALKHRRRATCEDQGGGGEPIDLSKCTTTTRTHQT